MSREIAPKLRSGKVRERVYCAFPHSVKEGIKLAARAHGVSANWLMEQKMLRVLGLTPPAYLERKRKRLQLARRAS
jgi:hypothetical protein